jgi:hypothetical protein
MQKLYCWLLCVALFFAAPVYAQTAKPKVAKTGVTANKVAPKKNIKPTQTSIWVSSAGRCLLQAWLNPPFPTEPKYDGEYGLDLRFKLVNDIEITQIWVGDYLKQVSLPAEVSRYNQNPYKNGEGAIAIKWMIPDVNVYQSTPPIKYNGAALVVYTEKGVEKYLVVKTLSKVYVDEFSNERKNDRKLSNNRKNYRK